MSKVGDFMSSPVLTTSLDAFAHNAVNYMYTHNVGALLVTEKGKYVGIVTKADWMHKVLEKDGDPRGIKVSSIMTTSIIALEKDGSLAKASKLMKENKCRHIAVTDNGEIIGMLSIKDLERYYRQSRNM